MTLTTADNSAAGMVILGKGKLVLEMRRPNGTHPLQTHIIIPNVVATASCRKNLIALSQLEDLGYRGYLNRGIHLYKGEDLLLSACVDNGLYRVERATAVVPDSSVLIMLTEIKANTNLNVIERIKSTISLRNDSLHHTRFQCNGECEDPVRSWPANS